MRIAVVGAGIMGCSVACLCADAGHEVQVFEREDRIGGLCADGPDADGDFVQFYGPHIFHTRNPIVIDFVRRFGVWRWHYAHRVIARVADQAVPIPINPETLERLGVDVKNAIGLLYEPYSRKQWGAHWDGMRETALARVRPRDAREDRYFPLDTFQGFPAAGFSVWMREMLQSPHITVALRTDPSVTDLSVDFYLVFWTGRLDAACSYQFGRIPFRTIDFAWRRQYPVENLPGPETNAVRRTHFGLLLGAGNPAKLLEEIPRECGPSDRPTHPVITPESVRLQAAYAAALPRNVMPVGRFAELTYLDMDASIERAMEAVTQHLRTEGVTVNPQGGPSHA